MNTTEQGQVPDSALTFERPLWLEAATGSKCPEPAPVIDLSKTCRTNAFDQERNGATEDLHDILASIDPGTEVLEVTEDTPSDDEWETLGRYFPNLRALKVDTGFDECWVDGKFPLSWPLELLVISGACGEAITTPAILEGRIEHLVLLYTASLRFEGPTTAELMKDAEVLYTIPRSRPAPDKDGDGAARATQTEGEQQANQTEGIKVTSVAHEWGKWMNAHYGGKELVFSSACEADPPSRMRRLEILGNDALEMLTFLAIARWHLLVGLESLAIHSVGDYDLIEAPGDYAAAFLPVLLNLKHLRLSLGSATLSRLLEIGGERKPLHEYLPPNIETLHFRGPVSMAPQLDEFCAALADGQFLPCLKRISFVLDLPGPPPAHSDKKAEASLEQLREAKAACGKLLRVAAERGVAVAEFDNPWAESLPHFFALDDRWAGIGDV